MIDDITFARTRYTYDSYTDFWTLVELSRYPTCYIDEIDWNSGRYYITAPMNGELKHREIPDNRKCKIALWNLERPGGSGGLPNYINDNNELIRLGVIDQVIVSDKQLARDTGFHYVPIFGHAGLGKLTPPARKIYDVVHLMCYSPRRGRWFDYPHNRLSVEGIKVAPNGWGEQRHYALTMSHFLLNIHQDEFQYMEPLRFVLAACYGLPIVSETVIDWWPYIGVCKPFRLHDEVDTIKYLMDHRSNWDKVAIEIRCLVTEDYDFRKGLEGYL